MCMSSLFFFGSFNMVIPALPDFLTNLGGEAYKGYIISLFAITAMVSRPFSGRLADQVGRLPVMIVGSLVCMVCGLMYPLLATIAGFFLLRLVHGFSTGFTPTGQTAYLADIIPPSKRGEAMGILGTAGGVGMAGGPALGGLIANRFGTDAMFFTSAAFALVSITIILRLKETLRERQPLSLQSFKVNKRDLFEPRVLLPCMTMALCAFPYGALFTLVPDFGKYVGFLNPGLLFAYFTLASLAIRLIGGKASDRWGRQQVLRLSTLWVAVSMLVIATADTRLHLIVGVAMYGLGHGTTSPTLLAWATDLSLENFKGRGIASLYIFLELGIGLGAFASGYIYANNTSGFFPTFTVCGVLAAMAFLLVLFARPKSRVL